MSCPIPHNSPVGDALFRTPPYRLYILLADTHSSAQPQVCEEAAPTSCINNTDIVVLVRAQVSECMAQRCRFGELRYSIGVNGTAFVDLIQFNLGVSRFIVLVAAAVQRSANRQLARGVSTYLFNYSDTPYYGQVPSTENLGCALPSRVTSTVN